MKVSPTRYANLQIQDELSAELEEIWSEIKKMAINSCRNRYETEGNTKSICRLTFPVRQFTELL